SVARSSRGDGWDRASMRFLRRRFNIAGNDLAVDHVRRDIEALGRLHARPPPQNEAERNQHQSRHREQHPGMAAPRAGWPHPRHPEMAEIQREGDQERPDAFDQYDEFLAHGAVIRSPKLISIAAVAPQM